MRSVRVGVDVGGTFTDIIAFDVNGGRLFSFKKISTNPKRPHEPILGGLKELNLPKESDVTVLHATTLATNLFRGQIGLTFPKTALITTRGFRDLIEIGRQRRPSLYDLKFSKPKPLVPRGLRFEVDERIAYDGSVIREINESEAKAIAEKLLELGVESVAISLLHSYANPLHEKIIEKIIRGLLPNAFISPSYKVDPEHREYERTSTTVVNALLMPIVKDYLERIKHSLDSLGLSSIYMVQSNGGFASFDEVVEKTIGIIESGPAAGIMASRFIGELLGIGNLLGFDMGGTTAKAGPILNYNPLITMEYEVGGEVHVGRIVKGSGYPVRFPFIELSEVSAGGGTIIWVDEAGGLRVGPTSAGADPGPACYGRGGQEPTITDAHLLLGRIDEEMFLGGEFKIYRDRAREAFEKKVKNLIGLDYIEASIGAVKIVNTIMARGIHISTIERGIDPRDLTLVAYGGAGPLHACDLAVELGFQGILVPPHPGLFSAFGLLTLDAKYSALKSIRRETSDIDNTTLSSLFDELEESVASKLKSMGLRFIKLYFIRSMDMRYWGQGYELNIILDGESVDVERARIQFNRKHRDLYGYELPDEPVELVNIRVDGLGIVDKPRLMEIEKSGSEPRAVGKREVYFTESDSFEEAKIYLRDKLKWGQKVYGPAVVEEYDSTTIIGPSWVAEVGRYGELLLRRGD